VMSRPAGKTTLDWCWGGSEVIDSRSDVRHAGAAITSGRTGLAATGAGDCGDGIAQVTTSPHARFDGT